MDVSQYLEIFIDETKEHIQSLSDQILILEKEPDNMDTINEIFRSAHTLKGMAGTMGYTRMQKLTHNMENVFAEIRGGSMKATAGVIDVVFQTIDAIENYLTNIQNTSDEGTDDNEPIIKRLNDLIANKGEEGGAAPAAQPQEASAPAAQAEASAAPAGGVGLQMVFADFEKHAVNEAISKGLNVYKIKVSVEPNCILKAARAFLVFKNLEEHCEVIKSEPSSQDIEDEKFDLDFALCVISKESLDDIIKNIKNVSEISDAVGEAITKPYDSENKEEAKEGAGTPQKQETAVVETKTAVPETKTAQKAAAPAANAQKGKSVASRSVRVDIEKLDVLMNLVSELIIAKNGLVSSANSSTESATSQNFNEQIEYLERVTTNLHESVMKVRMMPIESVVNRFPRMIRELSQKLGKKMELVMTGEETELDRTVIDEIGDPLMHLLRNSADHGLESAEVRAERGKPEVGTIFLNAYQDGNNVVIEVGDDGNGIDVEKVRNKAIQKGTITEEVAATMTDKDIIGLLFRPSFSTAEKVSDVSGRGVGLDVVKSKIEALGGDVEVRTELGQGSTFIIRLPLTLAIIQALMVQLGNEKYAIALGSIQTIEDISVTDIKYVHAKEVIHLRGNVIPLVRLKNLLDVPKTENEPEPENLTVVIVKKGDKQAGLVVDSLIGQMEIVIKSLGKYININKMISGATILGDGEVALIIDANTLV
jgi:two-component system chemotaxis sensor kinase CheA